MAATVATATVETELVETAGTVVTVAMAPFPEVADLAEAQGPASSEVRRQEVPAELELVKPLRATPALPVTPISAVGPLALPAIRVIPAHRNHC